MFMLCACITWLPISAATFAISLSEVEGTAVESGKTYSISNAEELKKFASLCTQENNWCEGVTFTVTEDIDLNEGWTASAEAPTGEGAVLWTPISMFKGVLGGQNHTLKGFYVADSLDYKAIVGTTGSEQAGGIFCVLSGTTCEVKNLNIENSYIHSQKLAGTVAGVTDPSVDCNGLTISNVSSSAIVKSDGNGVGGILGDVFNGNSAADSIIYINDCEFSGEVTANNQVGGIVGTGWRNINITNCVNNGKICSLANSNIGGIYGVPQGGAVTITGCVNNGELVMSNKTETNVGGIVGFYNGTTKLTVDGCVNKADITCNVIGSQPNLGGIVGRTKSNNAIIKNSVNIGDIVLVLNGTVKNHNVGGIVGVSEGVITINNCANFGDITSEDEMACSIGGILGAGNPAITATNVQSITDCLSAGDIGVRMSYPGGIVGTYQRQNLKLTRCVVLGTVTELSAGNNGAYGGALIGNINNSLNITFEDCYFNSAYKPIATWVGIRADYGKASFTVKATGKDDVSAEYTAGANPSAVTNALKASGAWSYNAMIDVSAKQNLTSLDWTDTANGWTLEQMSGAEGDYIPMPAVVAELFKSGVIPPIENDSGSTGGSSTNQPDDESLVKKTVLLNSNTAGIKILGVRHLASDTQLNCDWTGSGFEMNVIHEGGDIVFYGGSTTPCYFRVYIDGKETPAENGSVYHTIGAGSDEIVLADVPAGTHNIKVIKVTGYTLARAEFFRVNFAGSIQQTAPADNELYIEYVGDSISCGWGTIGAFGGAYTDQDATLAYPLMVSDRLGADWSVTALSGQGLCVGNPGVTRGYLYASALRSTSAEYAFERKADAVVINIGTNDYWNGEVTEAQFKAAYKAFLETVKAKNGEDCKILCLYNTMNDTYANSILAVCAELGGENAGIYTYKTAKTNDNLHPNIAEHKALADVVVEQLADILDIPDENIGEGIFGGTTDSGNTGGSGGNTDGGNGGGSTLPPLGGDGGNGDGNGQGGIDKLPDTFDPDLIIGGGNKPSDDEPSDGESTDTETDTEIYTDEVGQSDGNGISTELVIAIALGTLFALSLALNIVLICILSARKKKEKSDI